QWLGLIDNNTQTNVGTFSSSATNYSAGRKFGDNLMLPAAGSWDYGNGALSSRGSYGFYWSSTEVGSNYAWYLYFLINGAAADNYYRTSGLSVRCIAE
ncbi:MAG: hypothetical protein RLZ62_1717, partial [Bacteroidota bacterium]